jgi:hypothetical protein
VRISRLNTQREFLKKTRQANNWAINLWTSWAKYRNTRPETYVEGGCYSWKHLHPLEHRIKLLDATRDASYWKFVGRTELSIPQIPWLRLWLPCKGI